MKAILSNNLIILKIMFFIFVRTQITLCFDNNIKEENINFLSKENLVLNGILTTPKGRKNYPLVIFIHGSGQLDMDSTIGNLKPFKDLSNKLSQKGIASFRYNKKYFSYPEKGVKIMDELTVKSEVIDDINIIIDLLSKKIPKAPLFLLGHSFGGGLSIPISSLNSNISGIISMGGSLRPLYEISYDQNIDLFNNLISTSLNEESKNKINLQFKQLEKEINILRSDKIDDLNISNLMGLPIKYQKSIKKYSGENFINLIDTPILVLHGKKDFQIGIKDFELWKKYLLNRPNCKLIIYDDLNHCFVKSNNFKNIKEYYSKRLIPSKVINDIVDFIFKNSNINKFN